MITAVAILLVLAAVGGLTAVWIWVDRREQRRFDEAELEAEAAAARDRHAARVAYVEKLTSHFTAPSPKPVDLSARRHPQQTPEPARPSYDDTIIIDTLRNSFGGGADTSGTSDAPLKPGGGAFGGGGASGGWDD